MIRKDVLNFIPGVEAKRTAQARGRSRIVQAGHALSQIAIPLAERLDRNNVKRPDGTYDYTLEQGLVVSIIDIYSKLLPALGGMLLGAPLGPAGIVGGAILGAAVGTEAEHSVIEVISRRSRRGR
jgi:hypothetical protein